MYTDHKMIMKSVSVLIESINDRLYHYRHVNMERSLIHLLISAAVLAHMFLDKSFDYICNVHRKC